MIHLTSNPKKVLIVARPAQALDFLVNHLRDMACVVEVAATPEKALQSAALLMPEIVILDDHLPDTSPVELTLRLRCLLESAPPLVFLLTLPADDADTAPDSSQSPQVADDPALSQIMSQLDHFLSAPPTPVRTADRVDYRGLGLDRRRHRAWVDGQSLHLTPTEFRLLWELVQRPGYVLTRHELTRVCKGAKHPAQKRTVDAHIKSIRRKLNERAHLIETVHGVGYRLQEVENGSARSG